MNQLHADILYINNVPITTFRIACSINTELFFTFCDLARLYGGFTLEYYSC